MFFNHHHHQPIAAIGNDGQANQHHQQITNRFHKKYDTDHPNQRSDANGIIFPSEWVDELSTNKI